MAGCYKVLGFTPIPLLIPKKLRNRKTPCRNSPAKTGFRKWKNFYPRFYGGKLFSLTPILWKKKTWKTTPLPLVLHEMREGKFQNVTFRFFPQKQRIFSKNIIRTKIFYVKFSTKMISMTCYYSYILWRSYRASVLECVKKYTARQRSSRTW